MPELKDDPSVRLVRLTEADTRWRDILMTHELPPEQSRFAATASTSLPLGDTDPDRVSVAIVVGDVPVGMFALDRGGYLREFDPDPKTVLLRAFYVAPAHQGRGYARAAVAQVADFVRVHAPEINRVVLTVNQANPAAIRSYLAGGFSDTGEMYLGGDAGPQHVFETLV